MLKYQHPDYRILLIKISLMYIIRRLLYQIPNFISLQYSFRITNKITVNYFFGKIIVKIYRLTFQLQSRSNNDSLCLQKQ